MASWPIQLFGHNTPTLQTGQTGQLSRSIGRAVTYFNGRLKSLVCIGARARYMDKSNGDGVETENSFTLGVI